jgi:F0F1-type ATP synthase assembly protein I
VSPAQGPGTGPEEDDRGRYGEGGYNAGIAVFSYIAGGILVWSLIGWGLDNLLGTRWIVLAGALLGAGGGFYLSHMHNLTRSHLSDPGNTPQGRPEPPENSPK